MFDRKNGHPIWKQGGEPEPITFKEHLFAKKILAMDFRDERGILLTEFCPPRLKFTGATLIL